MQRPVVSSALALLAALFAALVLVSGVAAHARYADSTPGRGEVLEASPGRVEVTFTQDIQKIEGAYAIEVEREDGTPVADGETTFPDDADRATIAVDLLPDLAPGRYVVRYLNVSDVDGHEGTGAFTFYVGVEPTEAQLALDAELTGDLEDEETPAASPEPAETPEATAPADATPTPGLTSPGTENGGDEGPGRSTLYAVLAFLAIAAAIAGGYYMLRRRA